MAMRKLEIGSGKRPMKGYEHLDIVGYRHVDHICDASQPLPFLDGEFDAVYSSHVLEHIAWYKVDTVMAEWVRILAPGGEIDISVPNGLTIAAAIFEAESGGNPHNSWRFRNPDNCPYRWVAGQLYNGGKKGEPQDFHRAIFTPRYLRQVMERAGVVDIWRDHKPPMGRGNNLRLRGVKCSS